jgi:hypothetical protein
VEKARATRGALVTEEELLALERAAGGSRPSKS